jgi:hypothetical protein
MRKPKLVLCLSLILYIVSVGCYQTQTALKGETARDLCDCGPNVCLNDPRYPPKLAKKKADLKSAGYPDDLIALMDRDGHCVMAIDQSPDTFHIMLVKANGDNSSYPWTQHDENLAKQEILDGTIKEYYKLNVKRVFACCKEQKAEERPDWNSDLGLNRNLSIVCSKQGSAVVCK